MKKTLVTAALLAALTSVPAVMADDEYTVSTKNDYESNRGNYYGFTIKLTDTFLDATATSETASDLADLSEVVLNSLSLQQRTTSSSLSRNTVYLAVYEYTSDNTTGTFVGVSSNSITDNASGGWNTFTFTDVTIDPNKQYQYMFVDTNDVESITSFNDYKTHSLQCGFEMSNITDALPQGDGVYKNNAISDWEGSYIPNLSVSVTATPEPTTATLSLLALAGLCARRRRK